MNNKTKKTISALALTGTLIFGLSGCKNNNPSDDSDAFSKNIKILEEYNKDYTGDAQFYVMYTGLYSTVEGPYYSLEEAEQASYKLLKSCTNVEKIEIGCLVLACGGVAFMGIDIIYNEKKYRQYRYDYYSKSNDNECVKTKKREKNNH